MDNLEDIGLRKKEAWFLAVIVLFVIAVSLLLAFPKSKDADYHRNGKTQSGCVLYQHSGDGKEFTRTRDGKYSQSPDGCWYTLKNIPAKS